MIKALVCHINRLVFHLGGSDVPLVVSVYCFCLPRIRFLPFVTWPLAAHLLADLPFSVRHGSGKLANHSLLLPA